jgi:hypothetical protein
VETGNQNAPLRLRGLIPSLGAGGSLIAAALCAFAVFGGILAFRGESPGTAEANSGDVALPIGRVRARTASSTLRAPAPTAAAAVATTRPAAPRATSRRRRQAAALPRLKRTAPRVTSQARTVPAPTPTTPPPTTGGSAAGPPPQPVATPAVSVERAVARTRAVAKPVVDAAPAPAQAPVNTVADTVEHVAGTVDALLSP